MFVDESFFNNSKTVSNNSHEAVWLLLKVCCKSWGANFIWNDFMHHKKWCSQMLRCQIVLSGGLMDINSLVEKYTNFYRRISHHQWSYHLHNMSQKQWQKTLPTLVLEPYKLLRYKKPTDWWLFSFMYCSLSVWVLTPVLFFLPIPTTLYLHIGIPLPN